MSDLKSILKSIGDAKDIPTEKVVDQYSESFDLTKGPDDFLAILNRTFAIAIGIYWRKFGESPVYYRAKLYQDHDNLQFRVQVRGEDVSHQAQTEST